MSLCELCCELVELPWLHVHCHSNMQLTGLKLPRIKHHLQCTFWPGPWCSQHVLLAACSGFFGFFAYPAGEYQRWGTSCSTFWGAWAFLLGSYIQLVEMLN